MVQDDIQLNKSNNLHYFKHASNLILMSIVSDKLLEVQLFVVYFYSILIYSDFNYKNNNIS